MKIYKLTFLLLAAFIFAACQSAANNQPLSPTETMKALNDAAKKKDAEAIKNLVSQGTLDLLAQSAQQQKTTVDELLKRDESASFQELPQTRNEKIMGDTATIEIKNNATNDWETMPFVKENGVWKIALDKFLEDAMKRMNEEMKEIPDNSPPAARAETPKTEANSAANK
jgi:hypothetical protein